MSTRTETTQQKLSTLSSSKFAAAMGIHPYMSRAKLWRILTGREKPQPKQQNMAWGQHNEWRGVVAVEAHTGLLFDHTGDNQKSWQDGRLTSTPDGVCWDVEVGLEVKCPEKCYDEIPPYYVPQIQGQIHVLGLAGVNFGCWGHNFFRCWEVYRSHEYISEMLPLLEEFLGYLDNDQEPPRMSRKPVMPPVTVLELTQEQEKD